MPEREGPFSANRSFYRIFAGEKGDAKGRKKDFFKIFEFFAPKFIDNELHRCYNMNAIENVVGSTSFTSF
jgi:hypothetical protein